MVMAVRVQTNTKTLQDRLNRIVNTTPQAMADAGMEFMEILKRNVRIEMIRNGNIFSGKALKSVRAVQKSKFRIELKMSQRAIWLDRARPHFVKLKRGRLIRQWAMQKGSPGVKAIAAREGSIYVRPHPFFDVAFDRSIGKLTEVFKGRLRRSLQ